ncbi:hypothetical protein IAT40_003543 [Kwoniella sp. CBS 6097]
MSDLQDITHLHSHALSVPASRPHSRTKSKAPSHTSMQAKPKAGPSPMGRMVSAPAALAQTSMTVPLTIKVVGGRPKMPIKKNSSNFFSERDIDGLSGKPALPRFWSAVSDTLLLSQDNGAQAFKQTQRQ